MSLIVIVDDRNTNRNIFAKLAASIEPDITVRTFGDPGEALVWLADHAPDLVITDYKMPGMDGAEFIRLFRELPAAGDIPVITGNTITDCFIGLYLRNSGLPEYNIGNIIAGSSTVVVLSDTPHPFVAGDSVTLAGIAAPFNSVNGNRSITLVDGDQITISFDTSGVGGSYVPAADTMKYASGTDGQLSMLEHCGTYTGNTISDPKTGGYFVYGENGTTYADLDMDQNAYSGTGKWKWDGGTDSTTFAAWKEAADPRDAASTYEA
jgi:hypothetical protein